MAITDPERTLALDDDLREAFQNNLHLLITTDFEHYEEDAINILVRVTNAFNMNVVMVTFNEHTRDIAEDIARRGGNLNKLYLIDAISLIIGKGTPPVRQLITVSEPDKFDDIEVYTNLFLERKKGEPTCVFMFQIDKLLEYQNRDEVGLFFHVFCQQTKKKGVPLIVLLHKSTEQILQNIVAANVERDIDINPRIWQYKIEKRRGQEWESK